MTSLKKAPQRNYNSLKYWMFDNKPCSREETEFIKYRDDIVALAEGEEAGWFDRCIEECLNALPKRVAKVRTQRILNVRSSPLEACQWIE